MSKDDRLKSAYELALERLRAKDEQAGVEQRRPLSDAEKEQIATLKAHARAKLAEREIMFKKHLESAAGDPEKTQKLEEQYRTDRHRAESGLESAIAAVRGKRS